MSFTPTMKLHIAAIAVASLSPLACFQFPATEAGGAALGSEVTGGSESTETSAQTNASPSTSSASTTTLSSSSGSTLAEADSLDKSESTGQTTESPPLCGDGIVDAREACDDGDEDDGNTCTNTCTLATCGDGIKADNEVCDDGNKDDADTCTSVCALPSCGDAVIHAGEECDDGAETASCDVNCTLAACGDGVLNQSAGEVCDDGNHLGGDECSLACAPTEIAGLAVGGDHTCVALKSGVVRCWGQNELGALGQGDTEDRGGAPGELPVANINIGGEAAQVSSGGYHTCARLVDGEVLCWGYGGNGQLGYGMSVDNVGDAPGEMPPKHVDLGGVAVQIGAGGLHSCAIMEGGTVRCWGFGSSGQLGYETTAPLFAPNKIDVPGLEGVVELALGSNHTCVLQESGEVRCWGLNNNGQLGLGNKVNFGNKKEISPAPALNLGPAVQISAGGLHTCALMKEDNTVRCWGDGHYGQLGNGLAGLLADVGDEENEMPPSPVLLGGPVMQVVAGYLHTCALLETGEVKCWGYAGYGSLGYGDIENVDQIEEFPPQSVPLGGNVSLLGSAAGYDDVPSRGRATCALLVGGSLRCWGSNEFGQLGHGHLLPIGDTQTPVPY